MSLIPCPNRRRSRGTNASVHTGRGKIKHNMIKSANHNVLKQDFGLTVNANPA